MNDKVRFLADQLRLWTHNPEPDERFPAALLFSAVQMRVNPSEVYTQAKRGMQGPNPLPTYREIAPPGH